MSEISELTQKATGQNPGRSDEGVIGTNDREREHDETLSLGDIDR